jgi:hypothetical protein
VEGVWWPSYASRSPTCVPSRVKATSSVGGGGEGGSQVEGVWALEADGVLTCSSSWIYACEGAGLVTVSNELAMSSIKTPGVAKRSRKRAVKMAIRRCSSSPESAPSGGGFVEVKPSGAGSGGYRTSEPSGANVSALSDRAT